MTPTEAVVAALKAAGLAAYDGRPHDPPPIYAAVYDGVDQATAHRMGPTAHWVAQDVRILMVARTPQGLRWARQIARDALQGQVLVAGTTPMVELPGSTIPPSGPPGELTYQAAATYTTRIPR